jgi:hypothetical protein
MKDNDPLHDRLQAWSYEPTIPKRFNADVWEKIRVREGQRVDTGFGAFLRWLFPSPVVWQLATATAIVMVVLGAGLGVMKAGASNEQGRSILAQRYAQTVDPYLKLAQATQ